MGISLYSLFSRGEITPKKTHKCNNYMTPLKGGVGVRMSPRQVI